MPPEHTLSTSASASTTPPRLVLISRGCTDQRNLSLIIALPLPHLDDRDIYLGQQQLQGQGIAGRAQRRLCTGQHGGPWDHQTRLDVVEPAPVDGHRGDLPALSVNLG